MRSRLDGDESSLILRTRSPWDEPAAPHGIVVVGDIHGRRDRLDRVLEQLPEERTLVFLGDYVDRGPQSRGVITRLIDVEAANLWLYNGGDATMRSYGVASLRRLAEELPAEHLAWLQGLQEHWET